MNALVEEGVIRALQAASQAGVQIDLIVRGACALRPGVPGCLGEHPRALDPRPLSRASSRLVFRERRRAATCGSSSADWMGRNLFRRIEVAFPVLDPELRQRVDRRGARRLSRRQRATRGSSTPTARGRKRKARGRERAVSAQSELLARMREQRDERLMMDLILWRHAKRSPASPTSAAGSRPRASSRRSAWREWLERHLPDTCRILVSPADRAQQTAQALPRKFRTVPELAPGATVAAVLAAANWPDSREPVLIVGHQPTLGEVASFLLSGEEAYWSVRKGAVWWLSNRVREGNSAVVLKVVLGPDFV